CDPHNETIMEYIDVKERVFPVGRLDYFTSGLLILTNDGDFANKVMHPSFETVKTYRVRLTQSLEKDDIEKLKKGIELEDGIVMVDSVNFKENVVDIQLHEGKNRIVRRMFEAMGYKIYSLHRKAIGRLTLNNLEQGQYTKVSKKAVMKALEKPYKNEIKTFYSKKQSKSGPVKTYEKRKSN
ncbi:MAG: pseudouridine synthase, partial [Nanoarchaeota archaeon]